MKTIHRTCILLILIATWNQNVFSMKRVFVDSESQIELFSNQLSVYIKDNENTFKLIREWHDLSKAATVSQNFRSEKFDIKVQVYIFENDRQAISELTRARLRSSQTGVDLSNFGDEAWSSYSGDVQVRKENIVIYIQTYFLEEFEPHQNNKQSKNEIQHTKPNDPHQKRELSVRFAKHIMTFLGENLEQIEGVRKQLVQQLEQVKVPDHSQDSVYSEALIELVASFEN